MVNVIALDPGGTTGVAHYFEDGAWYFSEIGPEEHHEELFKNLDFLLNRHKLVIVCESFEFRQNRQRDNINLMSKEYIGIVKLFQNRTSVVFQTAAQAKGFVTDQKLKKMGLWQPGKRHANDATRHLVYYLVNVHKRYDIIECWKDI